VCLFLDEFGFTKSNCNMRGNTCEPTCKNMLIQEVCSILLLEILVVRDISLCIFWLSESFNFSVLFFLLSCYRFV